MVSILVRILPSFAIKHERRGGRRETWGQGNWRREKCEGDGGKETGRGEGGVHMVADCWIVQTFVALHSARTTR